MSYYNHNAHGDVVAMSDASGVVVKSYSYDAFGVESDIDAADVNPFRYCGEYYDSETGTIYLRARYYDPALGRFTQQDGWEFADSKDPLSLNLYTYSLNNPIRYIDSSGNSASDILYGFITALDDTIFGGTLQKIYEFFSGNISARIDSAYDYYLGRTAGDIIAMAFGIGTSIWGVFEMCGLIIGGAAVSVGSGGTLAVGGAVIVSAGVAVGTAAVAAGGAIMLKAASNFDNDWDKLQEIKSEKKAAGSERKDNPTKGESKVWKELDSVKGKNRKTSGAGNNKKYYEWDHTHNDIEVYDKNGKHLGSMDPTTGEMYKPPVNGRTIKP